ncbi:hypothetical protein WEU38_17235 [Cyanobacterium aponinum AL20118]|uniref:Uncharacterized protein n=3 Tax=Cyanobacterium aponinum TaxID=379064 RepID=K9Z841_CYAAP|nr:hypothetical protein [Cyanobacterium aponinum]AFZ55361.1 hypothetical protein Cyan10605_3316 [Cyanobacterium aponinum PCC 10605]MBD2395812.1 hypothetical protein [Cyanobacterium aponinum FACHB-4101]MTF40268.1 hypothetical protein [Cyanobacterium aponinum 0216]PHV62853.1 hypothetical protein CSQ80_08230 [Cyanobacterium aponinum IPPAS B-1201]WPF88528.1 hypothetical protein SAY89_17315 [Cyanobacterium aponinum AL20115]
MTEEKKQDLDQDLELQKDIYQGREFTLADFIAKEGGDFLKGESPVPKIVQLKTEINFFIKNNLKDLSGSLQAVLQDWVNISDDKISSNRENPLNALSLIIEEIISNDNLYYEFVRQVDLKWGQMYQERPYFQKPGQIPHPEDEYTHDSVKIQLLDLLTRVKSQLT